MLTVLWRYVSAPFRFLRYLIFYKPASLEESKRRLDICMNCEHLDVINVQCRRCLCLIGLKVRSEKEKCPLKKW